MADVVFALDVEDVIHPESDDALLQLCRLFTAEEVPLSLFVAGEKARVIRQRGRQDVITAMGRHEICYHGNYWGEFPRPALEYGSRLPWDEAVNYALSVELPGLHDVAEITGQFPVSWCCHQAQQAPPLAYAYKLAGVRCWAGGPRGWFMNWLSWPRSNCAVDMQGECYRAADYLNWDDPKPICDTAADLARIQESYERVVAERDFLSFLGHPVCWAASQWCMEEWSVLFRHGGGQPFPRPTNLTPTQLRTPEDTAAALETVRQLLRWIKTRPEANLTNYAQLCARDEEDPRQWLAFPQVVDLARQVLAAAASPAGYNYLVGYGTSFSCADLLGLFVFALQYCYYHHAWPEKLPVQRLLGPIEEPLPVAESLTLKREDLFAGALATYAIMLDERRVPGRLQARFVGVGPAELMYGLAALLVQTADTGQLAAEVTVPELSPLPACIHETAITERRFGSTHRPVDLDFQPLWDRLRWQAWSYRPAVRPG
jgi:hypothetical protein